MGWNIFLYMSFEFCGILDGCDYCILGLGFRSIKAYIYTCGQAWSICLFEKRGSWTSKIPLPEQEHIGIPEFWKNRYFICKNFLSVYLNEVVAVTCLLSQKNLNSAMLFAWQGH